MLPATLYDEEGYPVRICDMCHDDYAGTDGTCDACAEALDQQYLAWIADHPEDGPDYSDSFPLLPTTFPEAH